MKSDRSKGRRAASGTDQPPIDDDEWLVRVAELASSDAGGVSSEFLGDYLPILADAATFGQFPGRAQLDAVRLQGRRAAEAGVPAGRGGDLYLSAARSTRVELPKGRGLPLDPLTLG